MLLFAAGVAAIAAAAWYFTSYREGRPAVSIDPSEVGFPGMQLRPGEQAAMFTLIGRIRNKSTRATITEVRLRITMEDVPVSGAVTTAGETTVVLRKEVPPTGSKYFEEKVSFGALREPKGRHEWNYLVEEVKGK
jgi:hypothetical protein